ncbi:MAG: hypothetical protein ACI4IS_00545 [Acutalibacteraceae bacterium]
MHKSRNMLIKLIILSFMIAIGVFVLTVAWFTNNQNATADGLYVASKKTEGLQVSFNKAEWDSSISMDFKGKLPLITGDGESFVKPALHINEGKPIDNFLQGAEAEIGDDYIEQTIYLRSQVPMTVSVTDIKVSPQVANDKLNDFPASKSAYGDFSKDYIAAAARVAIVKETKTVTETGTTTNTETFVYDPNPFIELRGYGKYAQANGSLANGNTVIFIDNDCYYALTATDSTGLSDMPISMNNKTYEGNPVAQQMFTVIADGSGTYKFKLLSADSYLYYDSGRDTLSLSAIATFFTFEGGSLKDTDSGKYLTYNGNTFAMADTATSSKLKLLTSAPCSIIEGKENGAVAEDTYYDGDVNRTLTDSPTVELSGTPKEDEFYYGEIKIRIWAEGTDRDALLPLMDGKFKTELELTGEKLTIAQQEG